MTLGLDALIELLVDVNEILRDKLGVQYLYKGDFFLLIWSLILCFFLAKHDLAKLLLFYTSIFDSQRRDVLTVMCNEVRDLRYRAIHLRFHLQCEPKRANLENC